MSDIISTNANATPPVTLLQMMTGYWISQAIYIVAKLRLADLTAEGSVSCLELAAATRSHAPSLHRLLRALASIGVFTETIPGSFALTPLAALLRTGTPDSMRALAITYNEEQYRAWGDMLYSVQTGKPAFEHAFGMPVFTYFAEHPEPGRLFNEAMTSWTNQLVIGVVDAYDFSRFGTVVDVGGGHGALLASMLERNPGVHGILFDQPHVVAEARDYFTTVGAANRSTTVSGDFSWSSLAVGTRMCCRRSCMIGMTSGA